MEARKLHLQLTWSGMSMGGLIAQAMIAQIAGSADAEGAQ